MREILCYFVKEVILPMFLVGIPSLLFRPTSIFLPILVPLSVLVICGIILPIVLDGFIGIPLLVF